MSGGHRSPVSSGSSSGSGVTVLLGAPSGDTTGATDVAAINTAIAQCLALSGGGTVKALPGKTYQVASTGTRQFYYPSGGATASRDVCIVLPAGVTLDMAGSTLQLRGSSQASIIANTHTDNGARDTDLGLVNAVLDGRNVVFTTHSLAHFSYVDRFTLRRVKLTNSYYQGCWVFDCTNSIFDELDADNNVGQPWTLGNPQATGTGHNQIYNSRFGALRASNTHFLQNPSQPGNPYNLVLTSCTIESIAAYNCDAGVKIQQPSQDVTIGIVLVDTSGESVALNSGFKIQGDPAYGAEVSFTGDTTNGSTSIVNASSIAGLVAGAPISGPGIPAGATIVSAASTTVVISAAATATATTQTFTQAATDRIKRVNVGVVISRNCTNPGLYLNWTRDCSVGAYIGYKNCQVHTASADVVMNGGINDYIGSVRSDRSGGGGVRISDAAGASNVGPVGFNLPDIRVTNPGQNASSAIKAGFRVDAGGVTGVVGRLVATDDQTSHTMDYGVYVNASAAAVTFDKFSASGYTSTDFQTNSTSALKPGSAIDVQVFTANGTWTKPSPTPTTVEVLTIGGGGGGGGGYRGAANTARVGGGGGGGGSITTRTFRASALTATVAVTVGAGGTAGTASSTNDTSGGNGGTGGVTQFASYTRAGGGTGGTAGGLGAGGGAGTGGSGLVSGANGGTGPTSGGAGTTAPAAQAAGGGGGGGGLSSGNLETVGATGSPMLSVPLNPGTAGAVTGGAGGVGQNAAANEAEPGSGGGGGGSSLTTAGGTGGAGGNYGGGGGGGGASVNGSNSGAGGAGAGGIVVVISR
jgi:hypothetical protein